MACLSISILGLFQVTLDGQPVKGFKSNKVRALLAYLAVEADRPHRRESLAGLLWPDLPDRDALSNLRYALSNLRTVIGDHAAEPSFLHITRDNLRFNQNSNCWLDVADFTRIMAANAASLADPEAMEQAVGLYRGSFLEGFYLGESVAFEEWVLLTRERIERQALFALHTLASYHEQRGDYEQAKSYAWKQLEFEPWDESAHQLLMRAQTLSGQRSAALAQYETCRSLLAKELGAEPSEETTRLFERIRDGILKPLPSASAAPVDLSVMLPIFLVEEPPAIEHPIFVARSHELAKLNEYLELALAGRGRVAFVTGEAGSGKTSLIQEFTRHTQEKYWIYALLVGNAMHIRASAIPTYPSGKFWICWREASKPGWQLVLSLENTHVAYGIYSRLQYRL